MLACVDPFDLSTCEVNVGWRSWAKERREDEAWHWQLGGKFVNDNYDCHFYLSRETRD
jgi:hypothetical protein